jgi:hypothetical protein
MDKKMNESRDVLDIWKERIAGEAKHGDRTRACNEAGTTMTTYRTAMSKAKFADLTDGELRTLRLLVERLDDRMQEKQELQSRYAG